MHKLKTLQLKNKIKLLLAFNMTIRKLSLEEVLALLEPEEDIEEEVELDDPHEVIAEGSDEEFDDLEELEEGNSYYNNM